MMRHLASDPTRREIDAWMDRAGRHVLPDEDDDGELDTPAPRDYRITVIAPARRTPRPVRRCGE